MKYSPVVEDYFQRVIKKSWTWARLTEEEKQRFIDMPVFDEIKGTDKMRIEWLNTIYRAYLTALGYSYTGWRETDAEKDFIAKLNEAKKFVKGELELDCVNGEWFVMDYREDLEGSFLIEVEPFNKPIITEKEAREKGIDVLACCDKLNLFCVG